MKFTKEYFEDFFSCNPEEGVLTWKISPRRSKVIVGSVAGIVDREGYLFVHVRGFNHRVHRVIWVMATGVAPEQIDHINGNRSDNRIENLRSVSNQENARNQKLRCTNSSGHAGVCWHTRFDKWIAQIRIDGRYKYLGMFAEKDAAIAARKSAEAVYGFHENHGKVRTQYEHS